MSFVGVYSNLESFEGSNTGANVITFARKSRQITIVNDSASVDLEFKLNSGETYATLQPSETLQMGVVTKQLYLNSASACAYRIWSFG